SRSAYRCESSSETHGHEQAHDGETSTVIELAGEETAEHLRSAVRIEVEGALVVLDVPGPAGAGDQWNDHPGGNQQRSATDNDGADNTATQLRGINKQPRQ